MLLIKQISVFVENRPGRLYDITRVLAEGGANLRAMSLAETAGYGVLRLIVDDPSSVAELLREKGMTSSLTDVVSVCLEDRPGGLSAVLKLFAENGAAVEYLYAFLAQNREGKAYVVLKTGNPNAAVELLEGAGFTGYTNE